MKEKEYSVLEEASMIAGKAWDDHALTQAEKLVGELQARLLADKLVELLINYPVSNLQVLKNVFLERQVYPGRNIALPRVAMTVCREAVESFLGIKGIDYVSFQTCPQWTFVAGAEKMWFLVVQETTYTFGEHGLDKKEDFSATDLRLIPDILESMQDKLGALVTP